MRRVVVVCAMLPVAASAVDLRHQGRLLASDGAGMNGTVELTFRLWDSASGGTELSSHTVPDVVVADGYYAVMIPDVDPLDLARDTWLSVAVGSTVLEPREALTAVPRAASLVDGAAAEGELVLAHLTAADCDRDGAISWHPGAQALRACVDGTWRAVGSVRPMGAQTSPAVSCRTLHQDHPSLPSGPYWVDADGSGDPVEVFCDMETDGGGWTVVARASDTNGVGGDYEHRAAVGPRSVLGRTFDFGAPTDPQHLRGIDRLLEPGRVTVDVQYYCYSSQDPESTRFWTRVAGVDRSALVTSITPANPDFLMSSLTLTNANGDTTTSGNYAVYARGNSSSAPSCGNNHAGQTGMKFNCSQSGQTANNPQIVWFLTGEYTSATPYTEVTSCGSAAANVLPYYRGEVRIR